MDSTEQDVFAEFEKSFISTRSLNHLALVALREAHQTDRLQSRGGGTKRLWAAENPDWLCYERGSYIYTIDKQNQSRRLKYLHTKVEHQDTHNDPATIQKTSAEDGWKIGRRRIYDFSWGSDELSLGDITEEAVPSFSAEEEDRLHTLLLMNQVAEDTVGEDTIDRLNAELESLPVTSSQQQIATVDDVAWVEQSIIRLSQRYRKSDGVLRLSTWA